MSAGVRTPEVVRGAVRQPGGMSPPVLLTGRLRLRPRRMADLEDCLALDHETGTTNLIAGPWDDPVAHRRFVETRIRAPWPPGMGYWVVTERERPERFLGWVLLIPEDAVGPRIEIGWRLIGAARGRGFAPEAASAVLGHGFVRLGLDRIVAEIHRENGPSRRVAEKIGMRVAVAPAQGAPQAVLYEARIDCARQRS